MVVDRPRHADERPRAPADAALRAGRSVRRDHPPLHPGARLGARVRLRAQATQRAEPGAPQHQRGRRSSTASSARSPSLPTRCRPIRWRSRSPTASSMRPSPSARRSARRTCRRLRARSDRAQHRDRRSRHSRHRACRELDLQRPRPRRPPPAGLHALLLRAARLAHAAALSLPAGPGGRGGREIVPPLTADEKPRRDARGAARAAALQQPPLRQCRLLSARPRLRRRDRARRRRRIGNGRIPRSVPAAARANLRARLDEYTPAGMEAGIMFAS